VSDTFARSIERGSHGGAKIAIAAGRFEPDRGGDDPGASLTATMTASASA
jgi:hypothetical protein